MSMVAFKTTVCGVCGKKRVELEMLSSNLFPDRDLDFRESVMFRYGREAWIQECACGFVAEDLAEGKPEYKEFLNSKEYQNVDDIVLRNSLATLFCKYAIFNIHLKRTRKAFEAYLHAAWSMDDRNNKEGADFCRKKAISLFPILEAEKQLSEELVLIQADMLRRTAQFAKVKELLQNLYFHDKSYQQISNYQQMLAYNEAIGCFKESSAYAYEVKMQDDWKENGTLVSDEQQIKNEILKKYYPGLSWEEQDVFDRSWKLVQELNESMQCFYEKHRNTQKLVEYLKWVSKTDDYSFISVQSPFLKSFLENTFSYYEKKEIIRYAVKIIEYMKLGEKSIEEYDSKEKETRIFLDEIMKAIGEYEDPKLTDEEKNIKMVTAYYNKALLMLEQYEYMDYDRPLGHQQSYDISYEECKNVIEYMRKSEIHNHNLFGKEKDDSFKNILSNNEETHGREYGYCSIEEKAAHILYAVTKNRYFLSGNEKIAAALFLYYLNKNERMLFFEDKIIDDAAVAALTLMISASKPEDKELVINMIINCINMQWKE